MYRAGESGVDTRLVTGLGIDAQVGAVLLPDERSVQHQRIPRPGDGGKHLVAHIDALGGIHRLGQRLGDDDSDRFADITHGVDGERRVWCDEERRAIAALPRLRHCTDLAPPSPKPPLTERGREATGETGTDRGPAIRNRVANGPDHICRSGMLVSAWRRVRNRYSGREQSASATPL